MNAVWIDEGADADYAKLRAHGITAAFFSARDHTKAQIDAARGAGFHVGIYRVPEWDASLGPVEWATLLSHDVNRLGGDVAQLVVQADIETHDAAWISAFLAEWRRRRPLRWTSWTMEGFQGGWMASIRTQILAATVTLTPQAYAGDMAPFDSWGVVQDLRAYGFPAASIRVFYDAATLRRGWDGFAFTQARLP